VLIFISCYLIRIKSLKYGKTAVIIDEISIMKVRKRKNNLNDPNIFERK